MLNFSEKDAKNGEKEKTGKGVSENASNGPAIGKGKNQGDDNKDQKDSEPQPLPRRSTRSRQKSSEAKSQPPRNSISDDENDEQRSGRSQSRIDKWKAKHEAMLKMAEGKSGEEDEGDSAKDGDSNAADDVSDEIPNIESNGVCINLDDKSSTPAAAAAAPKKPHTRHSAVQQQALSV